MERDLTQASRQPDTIQQRPAVIGIAGGVGSGKSTVAEIFGELGCHVINFDAAARAALDRPEVQHQLSQWWGSSVIDERGRVDRSRVAAIVFSDESERRRLEKLIHPLIWHTNEQARRLATALAAPCVVFDAPLLFESGLDRECDLLVFVESPLDVRLERVRDSRGWDEAELRQREAAQMSLSEKRARAHFIVHNDESLENLRRQVEDIFATLLPTSEGEQADR